MSLCNRSLTRLQRRTIRLFAGNLLLIVGLTAAVRYAFEHYHPAESIVWLLALLPAIPVVIIVAVVARYLSRETDEFVRMLVVRALLWGFGITMVSDTVLGTLSAYTSWRGLIPIFNIDLFCVSAGVALRLQLWRNR